MSRTKIEWCDYSINPVKGLCPMACSYCYARAMYHRYKWNPEIRYEPKVMLDCAVIREPSKIFVGSTMELFGQWVKPEWRDMIIEYCRRMPMHTFIFLTKCPQNLPREWPDNCWVGVSTTGFDCRSGLEDIFSEIRAKVKFVSIEPLLDYSPMDFRWVNWVIIGQQTPVKASTTPNIEWVREIVEAADKAGVPVFLKNNLWKLLVPPHGIPEPWARGRNGQDADLFRQEFPNLEG